MWIHSPSWATLAPYFIGMFNIRVRTSSCWRPNGRGPIRRLLLGSVAAKALHDISPAVWTATAEILTGRTSQAVYRSILCPLDESDEAKVVLQTAAAFAAWFCAPARLDGFCTSAVPLASMLHPAS